MSPRAPMTIAFLVLFGATLLGCGGDEAEPVVPEEGGAAGESCTIDGSRYAAAAAASFREQVMPIFVQSCTARVCHGAERPRARLYLGPTTREPLTDAAIDEVHRGLVGVASETVPAIPRVAPGDPEGSFLMMKLTDTHRDTGHECVRQDGDPEHDCGDEMPPHDPLCRQRTGAERLDVIGRWIAAGAGRD